MTDEEYNHFINKMKENNITSQSDMMRKLLYESQIIIIKDDIFTQIKDELFDVKKTLEFSENRIKESILLTREDIIVINNNIISAYDKLVSINKKLINVDKKLSFSTKKGK